MWWFLLAAVGLGVVWYVGRTMMLGRLWWYFRFQRQARKLAPPKDGYNPAEIARQYEEKHFSSGDPTAIDERKKAREKLYDMVLSNSELSSTLEKHNASRETLRHIHLSLERTGIGKVNGIYVPTWAIGTKEILEHVLRHLPAESEESGAFWRRTSVAIARQLQE